MKRNFTRILAAFALLVGLTIPMGVWGQNSHTIGWGAATGDEGTYTNFTSTSGSVQGILSFSTAKNSSQNAPAYNANSSELRLYYASNGQGGSITIVPVSGVTITEAVMTTSTTPSVAYSVDGGTAVNVSATNNTYTISDISVTQSLMIQNVNTTNTQLRISTIALTYTTGGAAVTYTVTYDCNGGTSDCPDDLTDVEAGSSISLASAPIRSGYTFNGWSDGDNTYQAGDAYTVNGDVTFTAQWVEDGVLVFDLSSNPGGWPTDNPTTLTEYTYTLNNVSYTFALKNVKCNSGYLMMTSVAVLGLPAIEGYKLTKVVAYNSNSCSTSTKVGISSSASEASYIEGGAIQTWSNTGSQYTYNLTSTVANTMYYMYVTNKNAQLLSLALKYELDNDPAVATSVTIDASGITNTNVFESTAAGSLSATVKDNENNPINGAAVTWTSSNEEVATIAADGTVTLVAAGTTTITAAYAGVENQYRPSQGTYELTVTNEDPNAPGTLNNPYTVADLDASNLPSGTVYVSGIVSRFHAADIMSDGSNYRYYISDDGSTESTEVRVYKGNGLNNVSFSNVDDLLVGDHVVIRGSLGIYQDEIQFSAGNYIVSLVRPQSTDPSVTVTPAEISVDCGEHTGTLNLQALNLENYSYGITYFEADGETTTMYSWINVTFNGNGTATYNIDANTGAAQFAYFKVRANDLSGNLICYSNLVTVYQAAYEAPFEGGTYMRASSIESGKTYIIVGGEDEDYAMGADRGNNRGAVSVVSDGLTITVEPGQAVYEFVIASIDDLEGYYTIYDPRNNGYLYAAGGTNNNYLKTDASANEDEEGQWAINIDSDNSIATIVANFGNAKANTQPRNTMRFNSGNNPPIFSCYGSDNTMQDIYLYEKVATLTINGYTDDNSKTGYYLIASPVTFDPEYSDMTSGDFDLYYFDQNKELEWINYEDQTDGGFTLVPGKGYLYAKKATYSGETFVFPLLGEAYNESGNIELVYNEEAQFAGWNLIGNPFAEAATLDMPFYRMNEEGSDLEPVDAYNTVNAMEGVFVNAYDQELGSVTSYANFTPAGNTSGEGGMKINLTRNRGTVIDRAIVHFGECRQLPKFQINPNSTKIYVTEGNKDFAIVRSAAQGEMPVSFRASENGTYTIAVEAENVDMNYLHLIDNMTGADVDLLATPNYTFEARTNDYTSRFRLVFSANGIDEQNAETFAFFNGTSWTVSNTGDATLQVVDITGRIISSETINGNATVSLNQPAGIYMLRLVNGNDVKVQKVVVR